MSKNIKLSGLGTIWSIEIFDSAFDLQRVESRIRSEILSFENNYSRFMSTSLLSQLNKRRVLENASEELLEILCLSLNFYNNTEAIFNIGIGGKLQEIGYDENYSFILKNKEVLIPDLNNLIEINGKTITLNGGGDIDFGGIGKGFLVDKIVRILQKDFGLEFFIVNGGGDIYVSSNHGEEVEIFLQNPHDLFQIIQPIYLKNSAVCGSSPHIRKWKDKETGKEFNHIIDPLHEEIVTKSTFVISSKAVIADVLATTFTIMNSEVFIENLRTHYDFGLMVLD